MEGVREIWFVGSVVGSLVCKVQRQGNGLVVEMTVQGIEG